MFFFFQAEDGIRDLVRSRGLGDVYKRQALGDEDDADDVVEPVALRLDDCVESPVEEGDLWLSLIHI